MGTYVFVALIFGGLALATAINARKGRVPALTEAQSQARVRELRAQGYNVKRVRLKGGGVAIVRSRLPVRRAA